MTVIWLTTLRDFVHTAEQFFGTLFRRLWDDQVLIMSAALTYYGFLAVIPVLLLGLSIADYALGSSQTFYDHATVALRGVLPAQSAEELEHIARGFTERRELMTGIGLLALVWIAMRIFDVLEIELNVIGRTERPRGWIVRKGMACAAFVLAGVLFVLSAAATSLAAAKGHGATVFGVSLSALPVPWHVLTAVTPVLLSILMFLCLYTVLPNTKVSRRHAFLGAMLAASVWELTKAVFHYFVSYFPTYDRFYGSLAGVTILVLWLNLTAFALLLGAEVAATCQEHDEAAPRSPARPSPA